jgi:antitoxin HigA-1
MALTMHTSLVVHPGDWLKTEIVKPRGVGTSRVAASFGVSRQAVSALLNGRASLSADMAIRFEMLFGIKADTLCRMQTAYDLARARARQDDIKVDRSLLAA